MKKSILQMKSKIKSEREEKGTTRKKEMKQYKKQTHKHILHLSKLNL